MNRKNLLIITLLILGSNFIARGQASICPPNVDLELGNLSNWHFLNGLVADGPVYTLAPTAPVVGREELTPTGPVSDGWGGFPTVAPGGGLHSVKLGSDIVPNYAQRAIYYINIPPGTTTYSIIYHYAAVLEIPTSGSPHSPAQEPRFTVNAYDSATLSSIPCAAYTYVSGAPGTGFINSPVRSSIFMNGFDVWYKPWTFGNMKFPGMNGRTVAVEFTSNGCTLGGHWGYGYFDMSCDLFANVIACGTATETLTAPPGFVSYQWLDSATMSTSYGTTPSITVPAPSVPTTYAVIITPAAGYGCPDTLYSRLIPTHLLIAPTNDTTICSGASVPMSLNATDITSPLVYNWTPSTGLSCTTCANPLATPTTTRSYTATVTDPGGCSQTHVFNITVFPTPAPISGNLNACLGVPVTLSDGVAGGVWTSANTAAATIGSSTGIVTGASLDTSTITYAFGGGLCATSAVITVNPLPSAILGSTPVCAGSTFTLTDATTGGTWTSSNTGIATVDPSTGVVSGAGAAGGIATIFYVDGGTGCPVTTAVTVNPLSPITGVTNVCYGLTTALSDVVPGGTWMSSNTSVASIDASGLVFGLGATGGTATITYTTPAGCTTTTTVTVNPLPAAITGGMSICPGTTTTLSDATTGGTWSSSTISVASIVPTGVVTGGIAGLDTISYTLSTGCLVKAIVTVNPTPPAITGTLTLCTGTTTTLSDAITGGTWSSSSTSIATVGSSSGVVSGVTVTGGVSTIVYTSPAGCLTSTTVTVNRLPAAITGVARVCEGLTTTLSDITTGGVWSSTATSVATVVSGTGVVSGASAGFAPILYTLPTGCSAGVIVTVNVTPVPIAGVFNVCVGATTTLADGTTGGTWLSATTSVATVGNTTGIVTGVGPAGGSSVITYMMPTGCLATATVTVNPLPTLFTVTGGGVYCAGGPGLSIGLTGSSIGVIYQLYNGATPVGFPVSGTGSAISFGLQTAAGTYTVSATNSATGCARTMTGSATITVNPVPSLFTITGGGSYCAGGVGFPIGLTGSTVGINYQLHNGLFISPIIAGTGSALNFGLETIGGTYTVVATNPLTGCTSTMTGTAVITVLPLPPLFPITGGGGYCAGGAGLPIGLPGSTSGITYMLFNGPTGISIQPGTGGPISFGLQTTPGTYYIVANNGATSCTDTMTGTATITINPLPAAITGPTSVCVGATITEVDDSLGGTWSSSNTANASIGLSTGIVTGGTSSTTAVITYTLPTGCIATRTISVSLSPAPIAGPGAVCVGSLILKTDAVTGGVWTSGNTSNAIITTPPGTVSGVGAGTASITYTLPSTGCFTSVPVTVNPLPAAITGVTTVCTGLSTTLSDASTGGAWSSGGTSVATVTSSPGTVWGASGGTVPIIYTLPTTCATLITVTVYPSPAPIAGAGNVCQNSSMILADAITGGTWTSSSTGVATIGLTTGVVYPITPSTTTITYTLPGNCTTTKVITVNPIAPITGPTVVCQGSNITLSDGTPGGTWSSSNTGVATVSAGGSVGGVTPGIVTITYTTGAGCTTTYTVTVNITPTPITGTASVCVGLSTSLGDGVSGGVWSSSNTGVATITATGTVWGAIAGTTTVTYALGTGCLASVVVTVNPLPAAITGTTSVCVGLTTTLHDATSGGTWTSSVTSLASVTSLTGIVRGGGPGTVTITYTISSTGCSTSTQVTVNPLPSALLGPASMCVDYTTILTESTTGGIWSSSATAIATVGTGVGVIYGVSPGTSYISYTLPTGCAATQMVTVVPVPTAIVGPPMVCEGQFIVLSVPGGPGGTWATGPASLATIGLTNGVLSGVASGTVVVSYTIGVGCNVIDTRIVNALSPITGDSVLCVGDIVTLTDTTQAGTWSSVSSTIATAITTGLSTGSVTATGAGTAAILYTLPTGCVASYIITVNPLPAPISGAPSVCIDNDITLTDGTTGGLWSIGGGSGAALVGPTTGLLTGIGAGPVTVSYTVASTGCAATATITVNVLPSPISGPSFVCPGSTITLTDIGAGSWSVGNTTVATIGASSGMLTGLNPGVTSVTYTLPITGCSVSTDITVEPLPELITGSHIVCFGGTTVLSDLTLGGVWSSSNTTVAPVGLFSGAVYGAGLGTATITFTTSFGCTTSVEVTVNPSPAPITGTGAICPGATLTLSDITPGGVWSSGSTSVATVNSDGVVTGVAGGTATISYTLGSCPATTVVTINPSPAPITGALHVCSIGTGTVLDATTGGIWSSSNTAIGTVVPTTGLVTGVSPGTTTITYTLPTGCSITAVVTIDSMPTSITGLNHVCMGSAITLTDGVGGGTWSSSFPGVATVGTFSGIVTGASPGATTITYAIGACSVSRVINVFNLPGIFSVTGGGSYCTGGSGVTIGLSGSTVGVLYYLYHGATATGTFTGTALPLDFGLQTVGGTYTVVAVATATGCSNIMSGSALITLIPTVTPAVSIIDTPGLSVCAGTSVTFNPVPVHGGLSPTYQWLVNGVDVASTTGYHFIPADGDVVQVKMTSDTLCPSPATVSSTVTMTVNLPGIPHVSIATTPGDTVCYGTAVTMTAVPTMGGISPAYVWTLNGGIAGSDPMFTFVPGTGDHVYCTMTSNYMCRLANTAISDTVIMTVDTALTPIVTITATPGTDIAVGAFDTLVASATSAGWHPTYQWFKNGLPVAGATTNTYISNNFNYPVQDSITCMVTADDACRITSFQWVYINAGKLGVTPVSNGTSDITVIPNPNKGAFMIKGSLGVTRDEDVQVEITNMLGQVVYRNTITAHNGIVNERITLPGNVANGMYLLNLHSGAGNEVFHIVVEQ